MATLPSSNGTLGARLDSSARNGSPASSAPSPAPAGEAGRDARGRFGAGNKGGPGNPNARRVAAFRQALLEAVAPDDLRAIIAKMVEAAKNGDVAAARLVLAYTAGKPAPTVDPDTLDLQEWQIWQQMPIVGQTLLGMLSPLQVPIACAIARIMLPLLQGQLGQHFAQQLLDPNVAGQPQPQAAAPAPPPASPAPAAAAKIPTSGPGSAAPVASTGAKGQASKGKQEKARASQAADGPTRPAAGGSSEPSADPQAEMNRLLALFEQLVGPALPASDDSLNGEPDWDLDSLLRT